MNIGEIVTLNRFQEEMREWLQLTREKCGPGGSWWNFQYNEPDVKGFYFKIEFSTKLYDWVLEDCGAYSRKEHYHSRAKNKYTFIFKGIDWSNKTLNDEVARQFKAFKIKSKMMNLEKDFA